MCTSSDGQKLIMQRAIQANSASYQDVNEYRLKCDDALRLGSKGRMALVDKRDR